MSGNPFQDRTPNIENNDSLRAPQKETFAQLVAFSTETTDEREVGIVLPVGCGKSGCITLAPFAFRSKRTLVVAPGLKIADQLAKDFDPTQADMFYMKCGVLEDGPYPEPVEIRGTTTNRADLDEANVVITNIQQLQGEENRWLVDLPQDYFDLVVFDEGHHSVASTYENLKAQFPDATVINFSATPKRADGQLMSGRIIYSYPVYRAIQEGYVKQLTAKVLNPQTLKYVRREDDQEIEVSLEEVRRLGEEEADFRRAIVTSTETLTTIVDASIRELDRIRTETGDQHHKIIASALNYEHCRQIVEAYAAKGRRVAYVHSRENSAVNNRVLDRLESHELDVIVQVRKLGEGFDHPYLSVAAVFSIFANLSPFVQFVGRIMRVIRQNSPGDPINQGSVVFHAGANIASRWEDFQNFSEADRQYFDQLLPLEGLDFSSASEVSVAPISHEQNHVDVRGQSGVLVQEIPLLENDEAKKAIEKLQALGFSPDAVRLAMEHKPVPTTRVKQRQAARESLDTRVRNAAGRIVGEHELNPQGQELDIKRLGQSNLIVVKSAIDRHINARVGRNARERHEFTHADLEAIDSEFDVIINNVQQELFDA